jgi:2,4-dichlorophenol 6-monooxygenase
VPRDGFVLLTGRASPALTEAAAHAAACFGVRIDVVPITAAGDVQDPRHDWRRIREVGDDGALLVRPDQIIAWRCLEGLADPAAQLQAVMQVVLRKSHAVA